MAMVDRKRAAIEFSLGWESSCAAHKDRLFIEKIDFWRVILPGSLHDTAEEIMINNPGMQDLEYALIPGRQMTNMRTVSVPPTHSTLSGAPADKSMQQLHQCLG